MARLDAAARFVPTWFFGAKAVTGVSDVNREQATAVHTTVPVVSTARGRNAAVVRARSESIFITKKPVSAKLFGFNSQEIPANGCVQQTRWSQNSQRTGNLPVGQMFTVLRQFWPAKSLRIWLEKQVIDRVFCRIRENQRPAARFRTPDPSAAPFFELAHGQSYHEFEAEPTVPMPDFPPNQFQASRSGNPYRHPRGDSGLARRDSSRD